MTAKEKAIELVEQFMEHTVEWDKIKEIAFDSEFHAKQCALIAVDEILNLDLHDVGDYRDSQSSSDDFSTVKWYINYWVEVKQEIEKL